MKRSDYRSVFPKSHLPRWIVNRELEKVDWMNIILRKLWPFFNEAYSKILLKDWEHRLETFKPAFANSVRVQELTLGSVAPNLEGLRMLELEPKGISMDVDTRWIGNASCVLEVSSIVGVSFPVQVKDIHSKMVFRFIFKPLVDELPGFGAFTLSIRKMKKFDFTLKVVGGDVSSIPGVTEKLNEMIHNAVLESLSWPMRICIQIISTPADSNTTRLNRHMFPRRNAAIFAATGSEGKPPVGILDVKLVQGRDLWDTGKPPDPFALLYIHATPGQIRRSTTIRQNNNPIWNEFFELEFNDLKEEKIVIVLFDNAAPQEFQVLGYCQFYLQGLDDRRVTERWLKVFKDARCLGNLDETKYRGQVNIELLHRYYDEQELQGFQQVASSSLDLGNWHRRRSTCLSDRFSRKGNLWELIRGILTITVARAENLLPADFQGRSHPYVALHMMKQKRLKKKTSVKQSTLNPIWHETFDFHVQDARQDMLIAEVWNDEIIGRDYLGSTATTLTRVLQEYAFEEKFRLVGVPSGRLYLRLSWENSIGTSVISDKPSLLSPSEHFPSSHGLLQLFPMDVSPN
ncbi:synaptotagmin-5 isoform X4 [Physcomitrium patens]|nr:synaptotagmin-5-like isoform X5 [Physcomitrium patens]|eukprot:XP_024382750.1 synaptotagmin-5-like isoform X5 [Physcomitrella patens]